MDGWLTTNFVTRTSTKSPNKNASVTIPKQKKRAVFHYNIHPILI